jgi:hypothetical protein
MHQEFLKEISDPVFHDATRVVDDFEFAGLGRDEERRCARGRRNVGSMGEAQIKFLERVEP